MRLQTASSIRGEGLGTLLSLAASLTWLAAAAVIAWSLAALLTDPAVLSPVLMATSFFALAALRAALSAVSDRCLAEAADARIDVLRQEIATVEAQSTQPSALGGPGALAALAGEKLEALRPYLMRYRPARMRSAVMPLVILGIAVWHSWAVALVLLLAGPLILVFMALVGWAAKSASERQMVEIGQLSDLLVDRLAALSDLRLIGAGPQMVDGFARASEDLRERTMSVLRIAFLSSTVLELFSALGVAMVAIWVGFSLLGELSWGAWGTELSPAAGIYLLLLAPEFFQPLRDLAAAWHDRAAAEAVQDEIAGWRAEDRPVRVGQGGDVAALTLSPFCGCRAWRIAALPIPTFPSPRGRLSLSPVPVAAASPPFCDCWQGWSSRIRARSFWMGNRWMTATRRRGGRRSAGCLRRRISSIAACATTSPLARRWSRTFWRQRSWSRC